MIEELHIVQEAREAEQRKALREQYDLEVSHKNEIAHLHSSYEQWGEEIEAYYVEKLKVAQDDRYLLMQQIKDLEQGMNLAHEDKAKVATECEIKLRENEVVHNMLRLEYENRLQRAKEARSAHSKRRVSEAFNALQL